MLGFDFQKVVTAKPPRVDTLNAAHFWQSHNDYIVQADRVVGNSFFYPIYQCQDLYSFSPLALMLRKGTFNPNPDAVADLSAPNNFVSRPSPFIDSDITRLGQAPQISRKLRNKERFVQKMARAMQQDVDETEARNPGKTNILLCGGRDSLNLLLLNWTNPVIAYSAAPNTPLVAQFVKDNGLDIEVRELLSDEDPALLPREIAESATMVDLENWKWAPHLLRISQELGQNAVFWKGQLADVFLTDFWRSYTHSRSSAHQFLKKVYKRLARPTPPALTQPFDHFAMTHFAEAIWLRGGVWQGAHMGLLRSITNCLWVSGYHGPHTVKVWTAGDLPHLTRKDLRPDIGDCLLGRPAIYPNENPSPPVSQSRVGLRSLSHFRQALADFGISESH